ncbi:hypothetical protein CEXT_66681 [Caerostris extrusa]|uniref:Secreted protein n=1 Tax=Caerostris extrusa TaxID=172846 RepID=A0AAV4MIA5_CAEEX|nr:hypothetical protein CEXT_66681 [Caerostris extrusa]
MLLLQMLDLMDHPSLGDALSPVMLLLSSSSAENLDGFCCFVFHRGSLYITVFTRSPIKWIYADGPDHRPRDK